MDGAWDRGDSEPDRPAEVDQADQRPPAGLDPSVDRGPEPKVGDSTPWRLPADRQPTPADSAPRAVTLPADAPRGPEPRVGEELDAGEPRDRPDGKARDLPDGSWEWGDKGLRLEPADNATADRTRGSLRDAEGRDPEGRYTDRGLTPAMQRIEAQLDDGHLEGCPEYTLKSTDRFKEKLAGMIERRPDRPADELADRIPDGIRYTFVFPADRYTEGTQAAVAKLQEQGYELRQMKNWWSDPEYKGVNSRWRDPDSGHQFEVQFHTPESWHAKQVTHPAYERVDNARTSVGEAERLRAYQADVSSRVPVPPAVDTIEDYRRPYR